MNILLFFNEKETINYISDGNLYYVSNKEINFSVNS